MNETSDGPVGVLVLIRSTELVGYFYQEMENDTHQFQVEFLNYKGLGWMLGHKIHRPQFLLMGKELRIFDSAYFPPDC